MNALEHFLAAPAPGPSKLPLPFPLHATPSKQPRSPARPPAPAPFPGRIFESTSSGSHVLAISSAGVATRLFTWLDHDDDDDDSDPWAERSASNGGSGLQRRDRCQGRGGVCTTWHCLGPRRFRVFFPPSFPPAFPLHCRFRPPPPSAKGARHLADAHPLLMAAGRLERHRCGDSGRVDGATEVCADLKEQSLHR